MIELYTAATPNGFKISIMLEETGLPYRVNPIDLASGAQKSPAFTEINPNGRIPAIIDDGFAIFESGAILIHLAEKTGQFLAMEPHKRSLTLQWLMWQIGGLGPMMGQLNVFTRYFPETLPSVIDRYRRECERLFAVMDERLRGHEFLAESYSIADIAAWPWVAMHAWPRLTLEPFPNLLRWHDAILDRPAVKRGSAIPPRERSAADDDSFANSIKTILA